MRVEDLFVDTMEDLRRRCDLRASEYDMVQVAGLVRRLVLDPQRPWEHVNRTHRLKVTCSWSTINAGVEGAYLPRLWLDPALWSVFVATEHADAPEGLSKLVLATSEGSMATFMGTVVVTEAFSSADEGRQPLTATVGDLVRHFAHREGGVHWDPKEAKNPLLQRLRREHDLPLRQTLLAAGRVVHRALEPLAVRVALKNLEGQSGVSGR